MYLRMAALLPTFVVVNCLLFDDNLKVYRILALHVAGVATPGRFDEGCWHVYHGGYPQCDFLLFSFVATSSRWDLIGLPQHVGQSSFDNAAGSAR